MNLNFAEFTLVETANTRQAGATVQRGQSFKHLRYRKYTADKGKENERIESIFQLSDDMFVETSLNSSNLAGIQIINPVDGTPFLAVVDRDNGVFLKHSDKAQARGWIKGNKFKSTILENALAEKGIIDNSSVGNSQKLELTKVGENVTLKGGVVAHAIYSITKDTSSPEEVDETNEEVTEDYSENENNQSYNPLDDGDDF